MRNFHKVHNILSLYEFKKQLGSGSYGTVYKAVSKASGETLAIKVIRKEQKAEREWHVLMQSELQMLKELNHPNLVRVVELCEDR